MKLLKFLGHALCILSVIVCAAVVIGALWLYAMDEPLYSWSSAAHVVGKK